MHHTHILQMLKICKDVNKAYAESRNTPEKARKKQERLNNAMNNVIEKGVALHEITESEQKVLD